MARPEIDSTLGTVDIRPLKIAKMITKNNTHFKGRVKGRRMVEDHGEVVLRLEPEKAWKIRCTQRPDRPGTNRKITNLHLNDAAKTVPQSISHVCDKKSLTV